jgi:PKD repeat protein
MFYEFNTAGEYPVSLTITDKYGDEVRTKPITVRVHGNTTDYRQPLVVVDRDSSGTGNRAVVLDYDASSPLPLSSAEVEGDITAVDISNNGEYVALVGEDGLLVKQVANAQPAAVYLPALGKVVATVALDNGGAYATVSSAEGVRTYLVQPGQSPARVGSGRVLDASRGGGNVLLQRGEAGKLADAALYRIDLNTGAASEPTPMGQISDGRITADGSELFYIAADMRLAVRDIATGTTDYVTGTSDAKSGLTISGDGQTIAYVNQNGSKKSVVYGRRMSGSDFELSNLTDQTGFYSDDFELGNDGKFLLAYGSRSKLRQLLGGNKNVDAENAPSKGATEPRPERVGVIRLDLSGDPQAWSIGSVNPRFVTDSSRRFTTASGL